MSIRVAGGDVPIVWSPSDLRGGDSDGHVGRGSQVIRALVYHRIVGTLETTVNSTFAPTYDDKLNPGERRVSSHFGLGHWGTTGLRIVQFVALENTAYCNGQHASDKAACTWSTWIRAGRPDPNEMTVSFEHEDNAAAGDYIVTEDIIEMSIALSRLLLSGNAKAIRAAGIRCSDAAAAQLGRITPSTETLVPHRTVAPVTKPYCWTKYGGDAGFPQLRYVRELVSTTPTPVVNTPQEADMPFNVAPEGSKLSLPAGTYVYMDPAKAAGATEAERVDPGNVQITSAPLPRIVPYLGSYGDGVRVISYKKDAWTVPHSCYVRPNVGTVIAPAVAPVPTADQLAAAKNEGLRDGIRQGALAVRKAADDKADEVAA